jgi:hypothetical protein
MSYLTKQYDKYLNFKRRQLIEAPEFDVMSESIARFTEPLAASNRLLQAALNRDNAGAGAKVIAKIKGDLQEQTSREQMYNRALDVKTARTEKLSEDIMQGELQLEAAKEQEKQQKQQQKTAGLRNITSGLVNVAGAALALPTGGASLIAAGALNTGINMLGLTADGTLTANSDQWDVGAIADSLADTALATGRYMNQRSFQNKQDINAKYYPQLIKSLEGKSTAEIMALYDQWSDIYKNGTPQQLEEFYQGRKP